MTLFILVYCGSGVPFSDIYFTVFFYLRNCSFDFQNFILQIVYIKMMVVNYSLNRIKGEEKYKWEKRSKTNNVCTKL